MPNERTGLGTPEFSEHRQREARVPRPHDDRVSWDRTELGDRDGRDVTPVLGHSAPSASGAVTSPQQLRAHCGGGMRTRYVYVSTNSDVAGERGPVGTCDT